jgi:hypothetical protein
MTKGNLTLTIPNNHGSVISVDLLAKILRQAGISREQWLSV